MINPLEVAKVFLIRLVIELSVTPDQALQMLKTGFDWMDGPIKRPVEAVTNKNAIDWYTKASEELNLMTIEEMRNLKTKLLTHEVTKSIAAHTLQKEGLPG